MVPVRAQPASGSSEGRRVGIGAALLAGVAAGAVAALAAVAAGVLLYSRTHPPIGSPAGSAFAAAVVGSALFWLLARSSPAPGLWLWVTALSCATAMSLVEVFLPSAFLALPQQWRLVTGLTEPVAQVLAAAGVLHRAHVPAARIRGRFLYTAIVMHYTVAAVTSLLVPWLSAARARRGSPAVPRR